MKKIMQEIEKRKPQLTPFKEKMEAIKNTQNQAYDSVFDRGLNVIKEKYNINTLADKGIEIDTTDILGSTLVLKGIGVTFELKYKQYLASNPDIFDPSLVHMNINLAGCSCANINMVPETLNSEISNLRLYMTQLKTILDWIESTDLIKLSEGIFNSYQAALAAYYDINIVNALNETGIACHDKLMELALEIYNNISKGDDLSGIVKSKTVRGHNYFCSSTSIPVFDKFTVGRGYKGFRVIHEFGDGYETKLETLSPPDVLDTISSLLKSNDK